MDKVKEYAKAVAGFLATIIANMVADLASGNTPWPHTSAEWIRYLITSLLVALGVGIAPANKMSQKQLDKAEGVIGGAALPEAVKEVSQAAKDVLAEAVANAPTDVEAVGNQIESVVDEVLRNAAASSSGKHAKKDDS